MAGVRSFKATLQQEITSTDNRWEYQLGIPRHSKTDSEKLVKAITFVSSIAKQHVQLRLEKAPSNRITKNEALHRLLLLSFSDFRLRQSGLSPDGRVRLASAQDSCDYIAKVLKTGIVLNGVHYHFFGHSSSQLKSRSCVMYAASSDEIAAKIDGLGDFSKLRSVGKKAKRIGLLFSNAEMALELDPARCEDIKDVTHNDYTYTDGCGLISDQLAKLIVQRRNIVFRSKRYLPSVFQIRYRGYKGVLTLHPALQGKTQVQFRDSMRKFTDVKDLSLSVVDYSKPYAFGYLNDEIVLLLHSLGISNEVLLRKQHEYLQFLRDVSSDDAHLAFQLLSYQNETALAEKLLLGGIEAVRDSISSLVRQEHAKMLNKRDEQRCRIMVRQSRLLFGICDPFGKPTGTGKLPPGTCFVRITLDGDGRPWTIINTEVLVTRNPCLHPGDLQKFKVVDVPEFSHLVDCIVFPTSGTRPSADLMSGGDLDGDKFFVTWDPDIIPRRVADPALYPGVKEKIEFGEITNEARAEYFARYSNASLGRVKNLYLKWARVTGPMSPQCQQLNRLFSQCVDGDQIKIPQNFEDPPKPTDDTAPFILDVLHDAAKKSISESIDGAANLAWYPDDLLDLLACRENIAMSEFQLIQLVLERCQQGDCDFADFLHGFNYSALSDEQQLWLLSRLPVTKNVPSLVRNGLLQSKLVSPAELCRFQLQHSELHWKPVFTSSMDRMGRLLNCTSRTLELFHKKIILLQSDERLTLMIYVPQKVTKANDNQVDASVRVFALPRSSGVESVKYRVMPTKINYRLYCDDNVFQLYQTTRKDTFIYLARRPQDESSYKFIKSKGDQRRQQQKTFDEGINAECIASVALGKIGSSIQKHVGGMNRAPIAAAEIYVISNRDVQSMRFLDAWLHYIDTEEVLPLFEAKPQEYRTPSIRDIDRKDLAPLIAAVVLDHDLSRLRSFHSLDDVHCTLSLLNKAGQKSSLRTVFLELLEIGVDDNAALDSTDLLHTLLDVLPSAIFLTQSLLESHLWKKRKEHVIDEATAIFPLLLRELVLSANQLQWFVKEPFLMLLQELKQMSIQSFADIAELIGLAVNQPEFALDLLLGCIEPESSRLLDGTSVETEPFVKSLIGIVLDHIDAANSNDRFALQTLTLEPDGFSDGFPAVKASLRIDSTSAPLRVGDHIRFRASVPPQNAPFDRPYAMDALVISSEQGKACFRCFQHLPQFVSECAWNYKYCGSFVTSKAMLDAVTSFYADKSAVCRLYHQLLGVPASLDDITQGEQVVAPDPSLNMSQSRALAAAMQCPLTFIWGPPGCGKTHMIIAILKSLLLTFNKARFLVTAPTHNAVDNILKRFLDKDGPDATGVRPLRVSTQLSKVLPALRAYTCDAMFGKDLTGDFAGHREARKRVKQSRLVFTTCVGAALGLLRAEQFDIVFCDEASQQTEPETLIPLTKGCKRAILVGDHVQLRATVQKHAIVTGFDISLFERQYTMQQALSGVAKVMLDIQYRMHPDICSFSSAAFYNDKLQTAQGLETIALPPSQFIWPPNGARKVFVQCDSAEDIGRKSKSNQGQVRCCVQICRLLSTTRVNSSVAHKQPEIAILTPYTSQQKILKEQLPSYTVSSIDGYQGREADIIVFVTVRSNPHLDIGVLKDLRRLNVAMTRAKAGVIIIGDRNTLVRSVSDDDSNMESKGVWRNLLNRCTEVTITDLLKGGLETPTQ